VRRCGVSITEPADAVEIIRLWPEGPPTTIEDVPAEVAYPVKAGVAAGTEFLRNISDPTLTVFAPAEGTGNGVGIIVAPGGGWTINAWSHEGLDVARWLTAAGYTAFLLKYRVMASPADPADFETAMAAMDGLHLVPIPPANRPKAISDLISTEAYLDARAAAADDGRRAIEIVREDLASKYGLRPGALGLIGFSAGAFLTVDVALDPRGEPLAFIAPIYGGETCGAKVPADAPPLFTAVAHDDILLRIVEGLYLDWSDADRSAELHLFARGAHGFGMAKQGMPSDRWTDLFLAWLEDSGITQA
jgi:acetyl esterase/lipase